MRDLPSRWFYLVLVALVVVLGALAYAVNPMVAAYATAGSMIILAIFRVSASSRCVPHIRATWFDVLCLVSVALVLIYLAPWGLSPKLV